MLWVAAVAAGDADPAIVRRQLIQHEAAPLLFNLGFVPDQAAPAPRFSRTPSGPVGAPPHTTTPIGEINW